MAKSITRKAAAKKSAKPKTHKVRASARPSLAALLASLGGPAPGSDDVDAALNADPSAKSSDPNANGGTAGADGFATGAPTGSGNDWLVVRTYADGTSDSLGITTDMAEDAIVAAMTDDMSRLANIAKIEVFDEDDSGAPLHVLVLGTRGADGKCVENLTDEGKQKLGMSSDDSMSDAAFGDDLIGASVGGDLDDSVGDEDSGDDDSSK